MENGKTPQSARLEASRQFVLSDDPRHQVIYDRLKRLVSPGAATFYHDACRVMAINPPLAATTHIVGHLLREIEASVRQVLHSLSGPITESEVRHKTEVREISSALGLSESDQVVLAWLSLIGEEGPQKYAHRANLDRVRPNDSKFSDLWLKMESVLFAVLDKFESKYASIFITLDRLAQMKAPRPEDVRVFYENIPNNPVAHSRFFNKLVSPKWLPLLRAKGVFLQPPQLEPNEDGTVSLISWPATVYLRRMASENEECVLSILKDMKSTDNASVKRDLLEIALLLSPKSRNDLGSRIAQWVTTQYAGFQLILFEPAAKIMIKCLEDGNEDTAFQVAAAMLEILPAPDSSGKRANKDPQTRLEDWYYKQFLNQPFQRLAKANSARAFRLVSKLLCDYLNLSKKRGLRHNDSDFEDLTAITRPSIGHSDETNFGENSILDSLITATRDLGIGILRANPELTKSTVKELEELQWTTLRRIALYLLSEFPASARHLVLNHMKDDSICRSYNYENERRRLIARGYQSLNEKQRQIFLHWVEKAKSIQSEINSKQSRMELGENDAIELKGRWQLNQLHPIADYLSPKRKKRLADLVEKYGEPRTSGFVRSTTFVGPTSDFKAQQLVEMAQDELISLLKSWEPKQDSFDFGPTREGLGRELESAIKLNPRRFENICSRMKGMDPTYVRSYIEAFHALLPSGYKLQWESMLELCLWITQQSRTTRERTSRSLDQDPHWGWARKAVARLISDAMGKDLISIERRQQIWNILLPLTDDPDPAPADDSLSRVDNDDPYINAINCTRGVALGAVIEYALWIHRANEGRAQQHARSRSHFESMPEVKVVLERHLVINIDPSREVRSVYGRYLPWLMLLDKKWVQTQLPLLFPESRFKEGWYFAAWSTYIRYVPAYNEPFEVLGSQYLEAVKNIETSTQVSSAHTNIDYRLAEHLMLFYIRGMLRCSDQILVEFWRQASDELRGHAIDFVGRCLRNKESSFDDAAIVRLKSLWEARLAEVNSAVNKDDYQHEMSAFGWWFSSGRFEKQWACDRYSDSLDKGTRSQSHHFVVEYLVDMAKSLPADTVLILSKIVLSEQPNWVLFDGKDEVREIISLAATDQKPEAKRQAKELINRLTSRGFTDYVDLLGLP